MTNGLPVNGRATDSQFAQNPIPLAHAMGVALAELHMSPVPDSLSPCTPGEVANALDKLDSLKDGSTLPAPFARVRPESLRQALSEPPQDLPVVMTHGAPIVSAAVVIDSAVTFESAGTEGLDPAERDLAIIMRSIGETFNTEVNTAFLDGYLDGGGQLPNGPALDWYGVVAAFR